MERRNTEAALLVIDPGHGGLDGGASAADGTRESGINLQIALRMRQLASLFGVETRMTRDSETLDYPADAVTVHEKKVWDQKARVEKINASDSAVLISIHQNKYPDPRPSGHQVLYAATRNSASLAELTQANLSACLDPENRRVAAPVSEDIFLMKRIRCPGILVECGFLSNPRDAQKLKTDAWQKSLAAVLTGSYLQFAAGDGRT